MSQKRRTRIQGFSLGELLAVLVLIALLAGLSIPAFLDYLPRMRLRSVADQIAGDVVAARLLAIERRVNGSVAYDAASHCYVLQPLGRTRRLPDDVEVASFPTVTFNSRGLLSPPTPVDVTLEGKGGGRRVSVSPAGRVRVEVVR